MIQVLQKNPDHHKSLIDFSMGCAPPLHKISPYPLMTLDILHTHSQSEGDTLLQ